MIALHLNIIFTFQVSTEWANEALKLINAMQKELKRIASGQLPIFHYDKSAPPSIPVPIRRQV